MGCKILWYNSPFWMTSGSTALISKLPRRAASFSLSWDLAASCPGFCAAQTNKGTAKALACVARFSHPSSLLAASQHSAQS